MTQRPQRPLNHRPRVIVTRHLMPGVEARMRELFDVVLNEADVPLTRAQLAAAMQDCDVLVPTVTDRIDADLIGQAGERLGLIANFGAGTEHIDLAAAAARKILVTNTPGVFTDDTADLTMAGIIGVPRRIREGTQLVRSGQWTGWAPSGLLGRKLAGKVLGIIGMGRIGQAVARRARGFDMTILYSDPRGLSVEEEQALGLRSVSFEELLGQSDFISLHPQLNNETHHLMGAQQFALMKRTAYLINTSRGPIIDEKALAQALTEGRIAGAGIDVYEDEPRIERALLTMNNVVLTPHLGSAVMELRERMAHVVVDNIAAIAEGRLPPNCINPAVFAPGA